MDSKTLTDVDNASVNNNDISTVGGHYNRNTANINNSTTLYGHGNSESFIPKFLNLIPSIDSKNKHNSVKSCFRSHPTAGEWLFRSETYKMWKSEKSPTHLLWLTGIPGAGKTVICSRVIDDLRNKQDHPAIFFYCHHDGDTSRRCDSKFILANLLRQLLSYTSSDSSKFSRILKDYDEKLERVEDVTDLVLTELIREISFLHEKPFLIIDGLDECSNLKDILREIVILAKELCIFITSRDLASVRTKFAPYEQIRICEDDIIKDIRQYVTEEVTSIRIRSNKMRISVINKLIDGAQGSFFWPVFQVEQLRKAETDKEMEDILNVIPPGMQNAIIKSLNVIDSKKTSEHLCSVLQLVVCARQPITLQAIAEVVNILEKDATLDHDLITREPWGLIDDFAGLLICVSGKERIRYESCWSKGRSSDPDDGNVVVPFHPCVKEYLLADPLILPQNLKGYSLCSQSANRDSIAKLCLKYRDLILKQAQSLDLDRAHYPFAMYAREWLPQKDRNNLQKQGLAVFMKIAIIVLILMGIVLILASKRRAIELIPRLLITHTQGYESPGSKWEHFVSCEAVLDSPKWFNFFGEPPRHIRCTINTSSQIEAMKKLLKDRDDYIVSNIVNPITGNLHNGKNNGAIKEHYASLPTVPPPLPTEIVKEGHVNETEYIAETEIKATEMFQDWVQRSGSHLVDEITSIFGTERENIKNEVAKGVVTSLRPPPPPSDILPRYNPWLDKPRPTTIEEYLRNFEVVFVVDDSASMEGIRWIETRDALVTIVEKSFEFNVNTVSVRFLNDATYIRGLKGKNNLMSLFDVVKPRGKTPLGRTLRAIFNEHLNRIDTAVREGTDVYSTILPLDIIVLTDGMPTDTGQDKPDNVIANAVKRLNDNHYHPNTMNVQIIQIANEEKGKEVFKNLVIGDNGRIVDTVPYGGIVDSERLLRILLGGVYPNIRSQLPVAMLAI